MQTKKAIRSVAGDNIYMVKQNITFGIRQYRWNKPAIYNAVIYFIKRGYLKSVFWLTGDATKGKNKYAIEICQLVKPIQNEKFILDKVDYIKLYKDGKLTMLRKPLVELVEFHNEQPADFTNFPNI